MFVTVMSISLFILDSRHGETCSSNADCLDDNSFCLHLFNLINICKCNGGYYFDEHSNLCTKWSLPWL